MKLFSKVLSLLLCAVLLLGTAAVGGGNIDSIAGITASAATDYKENANWISTTNSQVNTKYNNGDKFIVMYWQNGCLNCAQIGTNVLNEWMNNYSVKIYGINIQQEWPPAWTGISQSGSVSTPVIAFVNNKTVKTFCGINQLDEMKSYFYSSYNITPVTAVTLSSSSLTIGVGDSSVITATVSPSNATLKEISWKSSKTAVADVDQNGKVTALSTGMTTITATSKDGGIKATCSVTVAKTYTVTYDANGGFGAPASQVKTGNVSLTLSTTEPVRNGYTFLGWATSSTSTTVAYQPGSSYTRTADITLYAVWQKNAPKSYTVTYNANGGSGAPASQTKTENAALTLSSVKPTRSGYTFLGWAASSSASVAAYQPGAAYTENAGITLYAVWEYIPKTYTVTYNANGGSGAPASQTKTENAALTLSSVKPTRSGYTFLGWAASSSASAAAYQPGAAYTGNADITLYAVWEYIPKTYTVTYNANGGSGAPASQTKTENVALTLSSAKPVRDGYIFLGWATSDSARTAAYKAGGTYTGNDDLTLYAVWRDENIANPVINIAAPTEKIDYRSIITIKATAKDVYDGCHLALYINGTKVADGSGTEVSFLYGELKSDLTYTVKVVDDKGNVQEDADGNALSKDSKVNVNAGFFKKLIAFFKGLFKALPEVEVKP